MDNRKDVYIVIAATIFFWSFFQGDCEYALHGLGIF